MAKQGFPLTPKMTTAFARAIALKRGKADRFSENEPSKNWFTAFWKCHPQLRLRKMDNSSTSAGNNPSVTNNPPAHDPEVSQPSSDLPKSSQ